MAYIKIFPIKVTDKKALDYITNPDKTDEKILVSSFAVHQKLRIWNLLSPEKMQKRTEWIKAIILHFT